MSDDEIDVLWHGVWVLRDVLAQFRIYLRPEQVATLNDLATEIDRIRVLRVQRQSQRRRAKVRRRQAIRRKEVR